MTITQVAVVDQRIERIDELILGAEFFRFAGYESADIFKNQESDLAIFRPKFLDGLGFDGIGQFAGEVDGGGALHALAVAGFPCGGNSQREMRFSRPAGAVEHDGIVTVGFFFEYVADDERHQMVFRTGQKMPLRRWGF